jgi:hypothetical protein
MIKFQGSASYLKGYPAVINLVDLLGGVIEPQSPSLIRFIPRSYLFPLRQSRNGKLLFKYPI